MALMVTHPTWHLQILADMDAEANDNLNYISRFADPFSLEFSVEKTKVITTDGSQANIFLEGIKIETSARF